MYLTVLGLSCDTQDPLVAARRIYFHDQGSNLEPLHWQHRIAAIGPPGSPSQIYFNHSYMTRKKPFKNLPVTFTFTMSGSDLSAK